MTNKLTDALIALLHCCIQLINKGITLSTESAGSGKKFAARTIDVGSLETLNEKPEAPLCQKDRATGSVNSLKLTAVKSRAGANETYDWETESTRANSSRGKTGEHEESSTLKTDLPHSSTDHVNSREKSKIAVAIDLPKGAGDATVKQTSETMKWQTHPLRVMRTELRNSEVVVTRWTVPDPRATGSAMRMVPKRVDRLKARGDAESGTGHRYERSLFALARSDRNALGASH